jgi:hypothetical protein
MVTPATALDKLNGVRITSQDPLLSLTVPLERRVVEEYSLPVVHAWWRNFGPSYTFQTQHTLFYNYLNYPTIDNGIRTTTCIRLLNKMCIFH